MNSLSSSEEAELILLAEAELKFRAQNKLWDYYPETGPLRRDLYHKHMEFFQAGAEHRERLFMAANRIGKSEGAGGYELTLHLTGEYPDWWQGKRFDKPVKAWVAGDTSQTVRDILQFKLLGKPGEFGTGLIPARCVAATKRRAGNVPDLIESVYVNHKAGGHSILGFKSYDQGRESFQGTEQDIVWLDEEPPASVYTECLLRTMTTRGIVILTFTPLRGMSEVVMSFLHGDKVLAGRSVTTATWDDVPHLSEDDKAMMLAAMPPHQRDARSKGIPALGSGAIYPIIEDDILVNDFSIPEHYARCYAFDVGWNATAALWGAWDRDEDVVYLYAEYKRGQAEPPTHAQAIKDRGEWIPGVIDPASAGSNQRDGSKLMEEYIALGMHLDKANNDVEAGLLAVYRRMCSGKIKIFRSLTKWLEEFRMYHRDEKGKIVKEHDHLMDCMRYLIMSGLDVAKVKPVPKAKHRPPSERAGGWLGA